MQCFGGHRPPLQFGRRLLQRFLNQFNGMPDKPDGILLSDPVLGPASPGRRVRLNVIYLRRKPAVNIPAKPSPTMAKAEGSGVGVMSTPQLLSVLVPPPEDKSTKNKVHVPFSVIPPKVPAAKYP